MSDWLDLHLADELRPVKAPEELWGRVQAGRWAHQTPNRRRTPPRWLLATAVGLLACGMFWLGRRSAGLETLAARELDRTATLELRSGDAAEVSAWLHREAGVDVAIPVSSKARLKGARVLYVRGMPVGEVAYQAGSGPALLLVARAGGAFSAPARHGGRSWQTEQQVYAVAGSEPDRQAACTLCHVSL